MFLGHLYALLPVNYVFMYFPPFFYCTVHLSLIYFFSFFLLFLRAVRILRKMFHVIDVADVSPVYFCFDFVIFPLCVCLNVVKFIDLSLWLPEA